MAVDAFAAGITRIGPAGNMPPFAQEFDGFGTVQAGSISDDYKSLAKHVLRDLASKHIVAEDLLACALGVFQSFGVHNYLLEQSVGGAFWGLYVVPQGVFWQGDLLYLMTADLADAAGRWAITRVRDDCLVAQSSDGWSNLFLDSQGVGGRTMEEWFAVGQAALREHRWDYVTLLNTRFPAVFVAEMRKQPASGCCKVSVVSGNDGRIFLDIGWREEVATLFRNPPQLPNSQHRTAGLCFLPFELGFALEAGNDIRRTET